MCGHEEVPLQQVNHDPGADDDYVAGIIMVLLGGHVMSGPQLLTDHGTMLFLLAVIRLGLTIPRDDRLSM